MVAGVLAKLRAYLARRRKSAPFITVVSGLPRSGTSMMMKMLEAGGIPVLSDGLRAADVDNPEGYYELERVKQLPKGDFEWLPEAQGKAVKIIAALVEYLPAGYTYRVILMQRRMEEILASQRGMLERRGAPSIVSDADLAELMSRHLERTRAWLALQPHITVLEMDYNALLLNPEMHATAVNAFLGGALDVARMAAVVNPQLYRNRGSG